MSQLNPRIVFFDLDGTLTDPKIGITRSIQHALKTMNEPVPAMEELLWCIGPPLQENFARLVGVDRVEEAITLFRERFSTIGLFENTPYKGIQNALNVLANANLQLLVASSKPKVFVDKILQHFELDRYFSKVYGSELDGTRSDKSELLAFALSKNQIDPNDAVMIGDRKHDIIGANNNRLASIGVLYGYGSHQELTQAGAAKLADSPEHVAQLLI